MQHKTSQLYLRGVALVLIVVSLGCALHRPPESPYRERYANRFEGLQVPSVEAIQQGGRQWTFHKPLEDVWLACLRVAHQYEGLLGMHLDAQGQQRRLLFVHGQELLYQTPTMGFHSNKNMALHKLWDTWIAVAVSVDQDRGQTTVTAAWVAPHTGDVAPLEETLPAHHDVAAPARATAPGLATPALTASASDFAAVISALSDERRQIAQRLAAATDPAERWRLIPQATINAFFYHLTTQLYSPERWQEKFAIMHPATRIPVRELHEHTRSTEYAQHADLEQALGNWTSARLRRSALVVHSPHLEATLREVAERLKTAAKEPEQPVQLYILASPELNAFVVPNGDIFVTSGLLEALDSVDEVAAVIAHELDHLFQHDTTARLVALRTARGIQLAIRIVGTVAGAGVGAAAGIAVSGASAMASGTTSLTTDLVTNLVTNTVQMTSGVVGETIGSAMVTGHSQDAELRADANGARYLWAAGYDVDAELAMLTKLQQLKGQASERKEPIASGFMNARPGLDQRLAKMRTAIAPLRHRTEAR